MFKTALVLFFVFPLFAQPTSEASKLWAGISVSRPVFSEADSTGLLFTFAVVNDGTSDANPDLESSHLFINGVERQDWTFVIFADLRSPYFRSLPPGRTIFVGYLLGRYFQKPGVYTVRWESANFKSADLVFRIVPNLN